MSDTVTMDFGDYDVMLPPLTYCPGDEICYVFAVPRDNMVGTNELDNAIKLLEFKNDSDLSQHLIKKNFLEMVTGPFEFRFLPVWSDKEIAYSQSKGFIIADIQNKKVEIHGISRGIYTGDIENIAVFDAQKRTFVIEINPHAAGMGNYEKILKVIRFENDTFTVLAEHFAGIKTLVYSPPWFVYQKKIFVYNDSTTQLEAFDENFTKTAHPIATAFNNNQVAFRCMKEIVIHPTLPCALIIEKGKLPTKEKLAAADALPDPEDEKARKIIYDEVFRQTLYLFRWDEPDERKQLVPLLSVAGSMWKSYNPVNEMSHLTLSPDGKWLVFCDGSMRGNDLNSSINPVFVAVSVNGKNPLCLGKPVKLGKVIREDATGPEGTAWTTNPTAFVMCDGMLIYRWNLDKYYEQVTTRVKMPPGSPDPFLK
ncbi:MAG TPA: hypothetical protein VHO70_19645 [Chitinispirillaceae bacterium]|nr:hypothetical protein [Chitinispirillaceae bacterium]